MKIASTNQAVQTLTNKIKRNDIVFKHKLQRREGVWSKEAKSLLIDSLLRGYPVNPVYTIKEEKIAVIDGIQRLSTCYSFINDEFSLSKNLEPIVINNQTYEIAGKKYSKLDDVIKDELMGAQIQVYELMDHTDKEVRIMFSRLNGGKPLNTVQKLTPEMSDGLSDVIFAVMSHPFFDKVLSPAQLKSSVDQSIAIEILMLSEKDNYDFGSFSKNDKIKFVQEYNDKEISNLSLIMQALNKIDETFEEIKIPKTSVSFIIYAYYRCIKENKDINTLTNEITEFLDNYESNEEYKSYIKQGTGSTESVKARLNYWDKVIENI